MNPPSFWEMAFLAAIALLIFGPDRLPEMARKFGRGIAKFKTEANATLEELKRSADLDDLRDVRDELRGVGDDLQRTGREMKAVSAVTGPMASPARPTTGADATVQAGSSRAEDEPAPFDPDAT